MSERSPLPFIKMNGLGNDFIVFDARQSPLPLTGKAICALADRENGIGCDQLIVLEPSQAKADVRMVVYNADGGEVEACGNASRCIAWLIFQENKTSKCTIETHGGILGASATDDPWQVTINMGKPRFEWEQIPLAEEFADTTGIELQVGPIDNPVLHTPSVVNVGNPHAVFWVDDFAPYDLSLLGPLLEHHPLFPERANISLAIVRANDHIELKVWERGAGLTLACGTGACAAAVCAARKKFTERQVRVTLPGGDLLITWDEKSGQIWMTGPLALDGVFEVPPHLDPRPALASAAS